MVDVYHVTLTKIGRETLVHDGNGMVEVRIQPFVEAAAVEISGALHFKFLGGDSLVYAPGMWSGYTLTREEE